jgi:hypothetical protein
VLDNPRLLGGRPGNLAGQPIRLGITYIKLDLAFELDFVTFQDMACRFSHLSIPALCCRNNDVESRTIIYGMVVVLPVGRFGIALLLVHQILELSFSIFLLSAGQISPAFSFFSPFRRSQTCDILQAVYRLYYVVVVIRHLSIALILPIAGTAHQRATG